MATGRKMMVCSGDCCRKGNLLCFFLFFCFFLCLLSVFFIPGIVFFSCSCHCFFCPSSSSFPLYFSLFFLSFFFRFYFFFPLPLCFSFLFFFCSTILSSPSSQLGEGVFIKGKGREPPYFCPVALNG